MNAIESVEREVDKVLSQFTSWNNHTQQTLEDSINQLLSLRQEIASLSTLIISYLCLKLLFDILLFIFF